MKGLLALRSTSDLLGLSSDHRRVTRKRDPGRRELSAAHQMSCMSTPMTVSELAVQSMLTSMV